MAREFYLSVNNPLRRTGTSEVWPLRRKGTPILRRRGCSVSMEAKLNGRVSNGHNYDDGEDY